MNYYDKYLKYKKKYLELDKIHNENQSGGYAYSRVYVLNKLSKVIEQIPFDKFDSKIHVIIHDYDLEKLSKKNDTKIRNFISKQPNYKKKFYHVSTNTFQNMDMEHRNYQQVNNIVLFFHHLLF
jgi:hypothetical protein